MRTTIVALFVAAAAARAHFPFVVPEANGAKAQVVFSDSLGPDENVAIARIEKTKLFVRDAAGKDAPVPWTKGEHSLKCDLPGSGLRTVYGTTDFGVLQRGDQKPFRLLYYPKAVVGARPFDAAPLGTAAAVELVPVGSAGKLQFRFLKAGKPVADADVTVMVPGAKESKKVKADKDGLTPAFAEAGAFGAYAFAGESGAGEEGGKKYDQTRHYATLVVTVEK